MIDMLTMWFWASLNALGTAQANPSKNSIALLRFRKVQS